MRGKVFDALDDSIKNGITPAYAGKRIARGRFNLLDQDHPRLCGEKAGGERMETKDIGSPPPMRGKAIDFCTSFLLLKDHPRLCGEKRSGGSTLSFVKGSPPPMRGKANALTQ